MNMIYKDYSLKNFNTMRIDVKAKYFYAVKNISDLNDLLNKNLFEDILVLGGGSNILFTKDYDGIVIKNEIPGINVIDEDDENVIVKVGAGVNWHEFVMFAVNNHWAGIENLALIPGTVGAAPIQNIGAYGQEAKDTIINVEAYNFSKHSSQTFSKEECNFSYRNSFFKQSKKEFLINSVTFSLKKYFEPNLSYPVLIEALSKKNIKYPTIKEISETIIEIRKSKLPDYKVLGNCGSFFTNPFLSKNKFDEFIKVYPETPYFKFNNGYKLSAGWLIEKCGFKGKQIQNVGCYEKHALVIVNFGNASGNEVLEFANLIRDSVYNKFGIELEFEVNIK